ncbi:MAG TPA: hypothetical protein VNV36_23120 [Pseudomonas sp.]|uniref:hypothetical protein n=1 Tax=Pseudomonas sp. TaxID=306 RepID=UPI002C595797|nr:hypothetical protein [Pseudomonas sp.]HWH89653.1 hypothetical protein [Pseudomonas sp.]
MSDNVRDFPQMEDDKAIRLRNTGGGNPPGGGIMEARVAALEKTTQEIRDSLVGIQSSLAAFDKHVAPNLATKADMAGEVGKANLAIADCRTEITRVESSLIKWFIGTAVLLSSAVGAIVWGLSRALSQ